MTTKRLFAAACLSFALLAAAPFAASAEMVWNRGNSADPESLDPHKTSTVYEAHILRDLFEGLVMQDAKADLIPGAAESWTVSDDGTVYTFKLRAGRGVVERRSGDRRRLRLFVPAAARIRRPAAEYASMLYVVKNARGDQQGQGEARGDSASRRSMPKTFEVTLNAPTPYFLEMLTHQATYPVNRASIEKFGADWIKPGNLVSNGAFTLAEFVPNDHVKHRQEPEIPRCREREARCGQLSSRPRTARRR